MPHSDKVRNKALPYLAQASGCNALLRKLLRHRLIILCYHSVVSEAHDDFTYGMAVTASEFAEQMALLCREFQPVGISDLNDCWANGKCLPPNAVLVTFDDGYSNNLYLAAPLLRRFGVSAVFNVTTSYVGTDRMLWPTEIYWRVLHWPHEWTPLPDGTHEQVVFGRGPQLASLARERAKRLPPEERSRYIEKLRTAGLQPPEEARLHSASFMTWAEVRRLHEMGFDIGSHTCEHHILSTLSRDLLRNELVESKRRIEHETGCPCVCFAYPNGTADDIPYDGSDLVRQAGYRFALTMFPGACSPHSDPLLLRRINVPGGLSAAGFRMRVSTFHAALKRWLA